MLCLEMVLQSHGRHVCARTQVDPPFKELLVWRKEAVPYLQEAYTGVSLGEFAVQLGRQGTATECMCRL